MRSKFLDIPLDYLPKAGFHESHILKFKATKEKLSLRFLTSFFNNNFIEDKNFLGFLNDLEKDSLVLELEIDDPRYEFTRFNSFYDFLDSEIDFNEININNKLCGYSLFILGYPDNRIDFDNNRDTKLEEKYGVNNLDLKIFGSNFKWKIVGLVTNISLKSRYLDKLKKIYNSD